MRNTGRVNRLHPVGNGMEYVTVLGPKAQH